MGLKCSILGHSFEPTGTETERQEQGSEVVTVVRELEECTRCGEERVVSETTEVTAVVEPDDVDIDEDTTAADFDDSGTDSADEAGEDGAFDGVVDRSMDEEDAEVLEDTEEGGADEAADAAADAAAAVDELAETPDEAESTIENRDPEEEDAEILTDDDEPERNPGEWPDDEDVVAAHEPDTDGEDTAADAAADSEPTVESEEEDGEDRLAGITVPEGTIVCPECDFSVDAESSYRDGDPCPECGAWLVEDDE
jgi:hypothetical protein